MKLSKNQFQQHQIEPDFFVYVCFPSTGKFRARIFLTTNHSPRGDHVYDAYVENNEPCETIPFIPSSKGNSNFIPISPKSILTYVTNGVAVIRFAIGRDSSELMFNIFHLRNGTWDDMIEVSHDQVNYVKLIIPYHDGLYEDLVTVPFPSDGRFLVIIYFQETQYDCDRSMYVRYYFDVTGANSRYPTSPVLHTFNGREFVPIYSDKLTVNPSSSVILTTLKNFQVSTTIPTNSDILLNIVPPEGNQYFLISSSTYISGDFKIIKFQFEFSGYGLYKLIGYWKDNDAEFDRDNYKFIQLYEYQNYYLIEPTTEEVDLQIQLEQYIHHEMDEEFVLDDLISLFGEREIMDDLNYKPPVEEIAIKESSCCCNLL